MRWFTRGYLVAAAVLAGMLVLPFQPSPADCAGHCALEVRLASTASGHVQVFWNDGGGFREDTSTSADVSGGNQAKTYRLDLPDGDYPQLRFDPIDTDAAVTVSSARIVDAQERTLVPIPLSQFRAVMELKSAAIGPGGLRLVTEPGKSDPETLLVFAPPLRLRSPLGPSLAAWARSAAAAWVVLVAFAWAADHPPTWLQRGRRLRVLPIPPWRWVALAGALAAVASSFPVVFLGRSFVSPNVGSVLLYDQFPSLPGYSERTVPPNMGSDVGAIMWQQLPESMIQHRAVFWHAEWPVWNRYDSAGVPLLGQGQSMWGDPLHLLVVAANGAAWAWDLNYVLAKALLGCGLGLTVLLLTGRCAAACLVAFSAPFFGFFVYRLNHPAIFSFCSAPWPLLCWVLVARSRTKRRAAWAAAGAVVANAALLASGTVKEAYALLLVMNLAGAVTLCMDRAPLRWRLWRTALMAAAAAVFAGITCPLWLTFLTALRESYTSYDVVSAFQIQPALILGAFDEALFRPLSVGGTVFNPSANFVVLAGVLYFLATLRSQGKNRLALGAAAIVPLSFAFGLVPPDWVTHWPFFANIAHLDNSFGCGFILLAAVLAGFGFAAAQDRLGTKEGRGDLAIAGLLLFALLFLYFGFGQAVHRAVNGPGTTYSPLGTGQIYRPTGFVAWYLASLLVALGWLGWIARQSLSRGRWTAASIGGLAVALWPMLWRQGQQVTGTAFSGYVFSPPVRVNLQARSPAVQEVRARTRREPARAIGLQNNFFPGWTAAYALEGINGPDALMNPYYRELTGGFPLERVWDWRLYLWRETLPASRPFLDFLNVRYYFDLHSDQGVMKRLLKLVTASDLDVYESPSAWPRAFFTDRLRTYHQVSELLKMIGSAAGRPFGAIQDSQLAAAPALARYIGPLVSGADGVVPAKDYRLTEDRTEFRVDAPRAGMVVLTEAFWAGYPHVTIDGGAAHAIRVNHAFIGIPVEAGSHRVAVGYRSRWFDATLAAAALSVLALAAGIAACWKRTEPIA